MRAKSIFVRKQHQSSHVQQQRSERRQQELHHNLAGFSTQWRDSKTRKGKKEGKSFTLWGVGEPLFVGVAGVESLKALDGTEPSV